MSRVASRAAPWAAAFVARGLRGAAEPGGDLECHGLGQARGPLPVPATPPVAAGGGGGPPQHPPASAPRATLRLHHLFPHLLEEDDLASAVKGSLTLINFILCGGPGPSSSRKVSFFFAGNKCLFSPVLTCSCTVVRCGAAW